MISDSREKGFSTKQEDKSSDTKLTKGSSSSRSQWSALKDPRVVRVSRTFGGKDRHSKVCTIRGLRDRRVRLSVPTAIQLYDLQDRLGLNQPSKVVDWLLNVAKHEIDELPPLPISPRNFSQFPQSIIGSHDHQVSGFQSSLASITDNVMGQDQSPKSTFWNLNAPLRSEEVARENVSEKSNWIRSRNEQENQGGFEVYNPQISSHNPFPRATTSTTNPSFAGLLNNMIPYNSYYHWEPSNLSLSHGFSVQAEDPHNYNLVPPSPQVLLCPSGTTSFFPPFVTTQVADSNPRQMNQLQMLNSTSQNLMATSLTYPLSQPIVGPLQLGLTPNFLSSQNHNATQSNKGISSTSLFFPNDPKSFG